MTEKLPPAWACDLARKMKRNGIKGYQLAEELGVSYQYVSMLLNGKREPKKENNSGCTPGDLQSAVARLIAKRKEVGA